MPAISLEVVARGDMLLDSAWAGGALDFLGRGVFGATTDEYHEIPRNEILA